MPQRRCAGCGELRGKDELVRLALRKGRRPGAATIVLDRAGRMEGRGAYLCADPTSPRGQAVPADRCLQLAVRRGGVSRTLRTATSLDPESLLTKRAGSDLVESISQ